jgi:antitoxin MazE
VLIVEVKIETLDGGLFVRIPEAIAKAASLSADATMAITVHHGSILLEPQGYQRKRYSLEELTAAITDENRPEPLDWGSPVGREVW